MVSRIEALDLGAARCGAQVVMRPKAQAGPGVVRCPGPSRPYGSAEGAADFF